MRGGPRRVEVPNSGGSRLGQGSVPRRGLTLHWSRRQQPPLVPRSGCRRGSPPALDCPPHGLLCGGRRPLEQPLAARAVVGRRRPGRSRTPPVGAAPSCGGPWGRGVADGPRRAAQSNPALKLTGHSVGAGRSRCGLQLTASVRFRLRVVCCRMKVRLNQVGGDMILGVGTLRRGVVLQRKSLTKPW